MRPVTFLYKPEYDDGSHSLQYGLIAEEIAKHYPEMVGYGKNGQPNSVKYQSLAPMLLNEVQKQNAQLQNQAATNRLQQEENRIPEGQNHQTGRSDSIPRRPPRRTRSAAVRPYGGRETRRQSVIVRLRRGGEHVRAAPYCD
jgi:hypothetical protein